MDKQRGVIAHKSRARQVILFEGLQWDKITPTDIDLTIEIERGGVQCFVFGEFKFGDAPVPGGQRKLLERLYHAVAPAKRLLFIARHDTPVGMDVVAANCRVSEASFNGQKMKPAQLTAYRNVKDLIDRFVQKEVAIEALNRLPPRLGAQLAETVIREMESSANEDDMSSWLAQYDAAEVSR